MTVDGSTGGEDREVVLLGAILTPIHSAVALRGHASNRTGYGAALHVQPIPVTPPQLAMHQLCKLDNRGSLAMEESVYHLYLARGLRVIRPKQSVGGWKSS